MPLATGWCCHQGGWHGSVCTWASTCPPGHPGSRLAVPAHLLLAPRRPQVLSGKPCTLPVISVDHFGSSFKTQLPSCLSHEAFQGFFSCHFPPQQEESVCWVFRALYATLGQGTYPRACGCVSARTEEEEDGGEEDNMMLVLVYRGFSVCGPQLSTYIPSSM